MEIGFAFDITRAKIKFIFNGNKKFSGRTTKVSVKVTALMDTTNPYLPLLAGMPGFLEKIAAFVGIVVGVELRRTRAMGPAIAVIDWAAHDQAWPPAQG